jgi:serine/threonine protein phosphatase 1
MSQVRSLVLDSRPRGSRFALSDIHGCAKTFRQLLDNLCLSKDDQLFIIGDAVNRGPDSAGVLDTIIQLKEDKIPVFFLRGNHEQMVLDAIENKPKVASKLIKSFNSEALLKNENINEAYKKLLEESYHFIETEDYFLVHAGFNFSAEKPFEDTYSMLYQNKFKAKDKRRKDKQVLLGHNPKKLSKIIRKIKKDKTKLYIDNGCVNYNDKEEGNLLCFNMDTKSIILQPNVDFDQ